MKPKLYPNSSKSSSGGRQIRGHHGPDRASFGPETSRTPEQHRGRGRGRHRQEACLNASEGLNVVLLCPVYFMKNLLSNIGMIQHMGIAGSATQPDTTFPMVATKDIGVCASL